MKKIFTLALGLILTVAMFAADRKPTVTVSSTKRYTIVIDGRQYMSNGSAIRIANLYNGRHDVKVFEMKGGGFFMRKKLVDASSFQLRNKDIQIDIDRFGQIQISESAFGRDWNDHDNGRSNDQDRMNDRDLRHDKTNHDRRF